MYGQEYAYTACRPHASSGIRNALDIKLGGAALLTWGVGTLEATGSLTQGTTLTQGGVLDVLKVINLARTTLRIFKRDNVYN